MINEIEIGEAVEKDITEYKALYYVPVKVNGVPSGILVGKKETHIGIDVLSGGDILQFLDLEIDIPKKIRESINSCKK